MMLSLCRLDVCIVDIQNQCNQFSRYIYDYLYTNICVKHSRIMPSKYIPGHGV